MKIKEYKQQDIKTITYYDLRVILNSTFNKKIVEDIQRELKRRDKEFYS